MTTDEQRDLDFAIETIKQAGQILKKHFGQELKKKIKSHQNDFVTEADIESENFIVDRIKKYYPNDSIFAEESGWQKGDNKAHTWIVDPLDGTWNHANGIENFGVMMARAGNEEGVNIAAIYNPYKEKLAMAMRGQGVTCESQGKQIKPQYKETQKLELIVGKGPAQITLSRKDIKHICLWSTVDNAFLLLEGIKNAYVNESAKIWDLAPVSLLFEEMGLKITNKKGENYYWNQDNGLLAAPPDLFLGLLQKLEINSSADKH